MEKIDREKICPLLLRCFWKQDRNNTIQDYKNAAHGILPSNEIQIYTWPDATFREITDLLKDVIVPNQTKQRNSHFEISLVYPDRNGNYKIRSIARVRLNREGNDDEKCLADIKFETGDYLDIAIVSQGSSPRFVNDRNVF
mmetsp:Transcript_1942/g.1911  ORF Transcript_1942/g.1911 Transcript_1942/m.1911 type:complete len:141 (+) Transcript_1942:17-439(+)